MAFSGKLFLVLCVVLLHVSTALSKEEIVVVPRRGSWPSLIGHSVRDAEGIIQRDLEGGATFRVIYTGVCAANTASTPSSPGEMAGSMERIVPFPKPTTVLLYACATRWAEMVVPPAPRVVQ